MALNKQEKAAFEELRRKKGVTVVGYGEKEAGGKFTGERAVIVGVKEKLPLSVLGVKDIIPQKVLGVKTDVQKRGEIFALGLENKERQRPAFPGCSIGHKDITAGTFGALVRINGVPYLLSNNHVFANVNRGKKGDEILQPGPYDGGKIETDTIAKLERYIKIEMINSSECPISKFFKNCLNTAARIFDKHTRYETVRAITNLVDCALAVPINSDIVRDNIFDIGIPMGMMSPVVNMGVQKSTRSTGHTFGKITLIDAMANVNMGNNEIAVFTDQFEVEGLSGAFSAGGDSGGLILDLQKRAVGLLFAGNTTKTYCNEIQNVIDKLGLDSF